MLKLLTLNVWHDQGPWSARCDRIREWIERLDPDLIGFQEVLRGAAGNQLAELLDGSPHHVDAVVATPRWRGEELDFCNAVASRWPIVEREELVLPAGDDGERRAALWTRIEAPFGPVTFTCTHLNWRFHHGAIRERQVRFLADHVLERRPRQGFPPLLVGDLNAEPGSDEVRFLSGLHSIDGRSVYLQDAWRMAGRADDDGITWSNRNPYARPALEPDRRIDYVFVGYPQRDGVGRIESCRVVCNDAVDGVWPSDHFGVCAELRTEPLAGALAMR